MPQALQYASRSGLLAFQAAELALRDARIGLSENRRRRCAIVFGTHFGSIESVRAFDEDALRQGKRLVSATLFPDTVINAPAGYVGASFRVRGPNLTVSTGISSGLSALALGQELLDSNQADVVLAGGYDTLSALVLSLAAEDSLLHPNVTRKLVIPRPLDRLRQGWVLGEGAAVFVLERHSSASKRKASILARIRGVGRQSSHGRATEASVRCIRETLDGQFGSCDKFAVFLGANGSEEGDVQELRTLEDVFRGPIDVTAPKSFIGEAGGANALTVAFAAWALAGQFIPPTLGFRTAERPLRCRVAREFIRTPLRQVLVNSFDETGEQASLLLERVRGDG
jgi:3-oxoacyl-(acyl-carrier-protein) synthase